LRTIERQFEILEAIRMICDGITFMSRTIVEQGWEPEIERIPNDRTVSR
jgi:hypothetical protein